MRKSRQSDNPANKSRKVGGIAIGLLLAWQSGAFSLTQVVSLGNPTIALGVNPREPAALAAQSDALIVANSTDPASLATARQLALSSLSSQALNPRALRLLVFLNAANWKLTQQRAVINLAQRMTRREPGIYIWKIEDAASRNDLVGVLENYDLALRTKHETATALFPLLTNALADDKIRTAFAPYVKKNPVWLANFVGYALENSKDPSGLALTIIAGSGLPKRDDFDVLGQRLLHALVETRHLGEAKAFAMNLSPIDKSLATAVDVTDAATTTHSPELAWRSLGSPTAGVSFDKDVDNRSIMNLFAGAGERQIVASKLLFLNAATYRLAVRFGAVELPRGASMAMQLRCLNDNAAAPLWTSGPITPTPSSHFDANLAVTNTCQAQVLEMQMIGGDEQRDVQFEIKSLALSTQNGNVRAVNSDPPQQ